MTVPVSQRGENKLEVLVQAAKLVKHTLHITSNDKVFDVRYGYLSALVCDHAISTYRYLWMAHNIEVKESADYSRRKHYQETATDELNALMAEIELCRTVFNLKPRKGAHWVKMAKNTQSLVYFWKLSDSKKYKSL